MTKTLAMVLAGGQGKRMDILCHLRPKPALPFAGSFRVIDFSLSNCLHSHIYDVALLTDYQRSHMASYLKRWSLANIDSTGLQVLEPRAGSYQGTADAVYQNIDSLRQSRAETVLVLAGDHVYKMDYQKIIDFHERMKADATISVVTVPIEEAHRFGTVMVDAESRVVDFVEKSRTPQSNMVSMGIYVFNKETLLNYLTEDAAQTSSLHDFGYSIMPKMTKKDRVYAFRFDGYWQDIGTIEAYYQANMELTRPRPSFSLDGGWPIFSEQGPHLPTISQSGSIVNSIVSPGCVVKGRVENSILSPGVWVEEQAVVRNSIVLANVYIGYHSVVERCVVDDDVNIGKLCYVGFGADGATGDRDLTVLGKGAAIPSYTSIFHKCKVLPYVAQGDFMTNVVPSGAIVVPQSKESPNPVKRDSGNESESLHFARYRER